MHETRGLKRFLEPKLGSIVTAFPILPQFSTKILYSGISKKRQKSFCNLNNWLLNAIVSSCCFQTKIKAIKLFISRFYRQIVKTAFLKGGPKLLSLTVHITQNEKKQQQRHTHT